MEPNTTSTPQDGVSDGPYTLFGLRVALRALRAMGYAADRHDAAIYVWKVEPRRRRRR